MPDHFLDTNVLLYAISDDPAESAKRERAAALLEDDRGAMSVQVLQEFYVQSTRATRPGRLTHDLALAFIHRWTRFPIQAMTLDLLASALAVRSATGFSYRDSAIIAAARAQGCRTLYTEDMAHGREIDGLVIVNPFRGGA